MRHNWKEIENGIYYLCELSFDRGFAYTYMRNEPTSGKTLAVKEMFTNKGLNMILPIMGSIVFESILKPGEDDLSFFVINNSEISLSSKQ